jgi:hypothetical protein
MNNLIIEDLVIEDLVIEDLVNEDLVIEDLVNRYKIIPLKYYNLQNNSNIDLLSSSDKNINNIENIILIHDLVEDHSKFYDNSNNISYPIIYNTNSSKDELLKLLKDNFLNIKRMAFVFHNASINNLKEFLDDSVLFSYNDLEDNIINYSSNCQFIIDLVKEFNIQHLDYLACNTLNYHHWNKYYDIIKNNTNVIIGASNDVTGNIKYGGNWILENTNEDIKNIYFTNEIEQYQYTLNPTCTISASSTTVTIGTTINFIATVSGGTTPYKYQWINNGTMIPRAVLSIYSLETTINNNNNNITCNINDANNNTFESTPINITVNLLPLTFSIKTLYPVITTNTLNILPNDYVRFEFIKSGGHSNYSYQWNNNSIPIQNSIYKYHYLNLNSNSDIYYNITCSITDNITNVVTISNSITVNIVTYTSGNPIIYNQPYDQSIKYYDYLNISTYVIGSTPFTYKWFKDGTEILNKTSSYLSIDNFNNYNEGTYYYKVTDKDGLITTSNNAIITLNNTILSISSGNIFIKMINNTIKYSTSNNPTYNDILWPLTIINTNSGIDNTINVIFVNNISISYHFFIVKSNNIIFDGYYNGTYQTITIKSSIDYYNGLIQNGSGKITINNVSKPPGRGSAETLTANSTINGFSNITIQNIDIINNTDSNISDYNGWFCQSFFGYNASNNNIINCNYKSSIYSEINKWNGGIVGSFSNINNINKCYSNYNIGYYSGGILGAYSKCNTITDCYSTGDLGYYSGGIVGSFLQSSITINNCFSTGPDILFKSHAGGIIGSDVSYGIANTITINNCYSLSSLKYSSNYSSAIIGSSVYYDSYDNIFESIPVNKPTITINNCYSINDYKKSSSSISYQNFISYGIYQHNDSTKQYIILGGVNNCYETNGSNWSDTAANSVLNNSPITWIIPGNNIPYSLKSFETNNPLYLFDTYKYDYVRVGGNITLSLKYVGSSVINFSWYFNDSLINEENNNQLVITNARLDQNGKYTCRSNNKINNVLYSIYLNVIPVSYTILECTGQHLDLKQNGSNIQYKNSSGNYTNIINWPVFIISKPTNYINTSLYVHIETDLIIDNIDKYFIVGSSDMYFDGTNNGKNIIIGCSNYDGFIQNGTINSDGYEKIRIDKINIIKDNFTNSRLNDYGGYLCQKYFSKNTNQGIMLYDCTCDIEINGNYSGGLIGAYSTIYIIEYCKTTGNILGNYAGGIIGAYSTIYSINYLYSIGNIIGNYSGGIFGAFITTLKNSSIRYIFSYGNITGFYSGGLFGSNFGYNNNNNNSSSLYQSYTLGNIGDHCGGFFGGLSNTSKYNYSFNIRDCYTFGKFNNNNGLIAPSIKNNINIRNSNNLYLANNNWSNTIASNSLNNQNINVRNKWKSYTNDIPYVLYDLDGTVYNSNGTQTSNVSNRKTPVKITYKSSDLIKIIGESISLYVYSTGSSTINYQWKFSNDNGTTYNNIGISSTVNTYDIASINNIHSGLYICVVSNNISTDTSLPISITVIEANTPSITEINPLVANYLGGTNIKITGTNFNSSTKVVINNINITPTSIDSNKLIFISPALSTNKYNVTIKNENLISIINNNSILTVIGLPVPPTDIIVVPKNKSANISWTIPTNNTDILYYKIYCSNLTSITTNTSNFIFNDLDNDNSYTFQVSSINILGESNKSSASTSIIPRNTPLITSILNSSNKNYNVTSIQPISITIKGNYFYSPIITAKTDTISLEITDIVVVNTSTITCKISSNYDGIFSFYLSDIGGDYVYNSYTIYKPPIISNITPNQGSSVGGTLLTITGTNLIYIDSIKLDNISITSYNNSSNNITFTTLPRITNYNPEIEINCLDTVLKSTLFNYVLPPTITNSSYTGTTLTIIGTNLVNIIIYIGTNLVNVNNITYNGSGTSIDITNITNYQNIPINIQNVGGSVIFTITSASNTSYNQPIVTSFITS